MWEMFKASYIIHTLIPREVPLFQSWLFHFEEIGSRLWFATNFLDCEGEIGVGDASIGLAAINRGMHFQSNIEELSSKKIGPFILWLARSSSWLGVGDGGKILVRWNDAS